MTTYIEDIGRGRQRKLGTTDDESDGGHILYVVAVDHKLRDKEEVIVSISSKLNSAQKPQPSHPLWLYSL